MNRSIKVVTIGSLVAGVALLVSCTGKLPLGTTSSTAQAIDPALVSGPVSPCESGYAHPNVCCQGGPNEASACVVYPDEPFQSCQSGPGLATFPDPRSCCPLDSPTGHCHQPPSDGGPIGSGGGGVNEAGIGVPGCFDVCSPGFFVAPGSVGTCCNKDVCYASAVAACSAPVCACAAFIDDAGIPHDAGCTCPPTPACPTEPPKPACDNCPPTWQPPLGEPGLCCKEDEPTGIIRCFSQAVPPSPPPQTSDGGVIPVADATAEDLCTTASDCHGPLPLVAIICSDGATAGLGWTCVSGICKTAPSCN
jgi:hypothetical protein